MEKMNWRVAYRDQGLGHGAYGVLREDGTVLAGELTHEEASVISAAPEMLKVLEDAEVFTRPNKAPRSEVQAVIEQMRGVITKAKNGNKSEVL